jgi:hydroxymethylbilane synthase
MPPIRIATRSSALALWQANHVAGLLRQAEPGREVELVHVSTLGDQNQVNALASFGGMGVFTREVQKAVLDGRADLAVHSLKDLPTELSPGLILAAVPEREETDDALVVGGDRSIQILADLPPKSRIGTGSLRRRAQLWHARPDLELLEIRGNVDTRLRKLDAGEYDALVLAAAGLKRLQFGSRIRLRLGPPVMYAAVGQGALGLECREEDAETRLALSRLNDPQAYARVTAERALLRTLRAGCHAPVGAATVIHASTLSLEAVVLSRDGRERLTAESQMAIEQAEALGVTVAGELLARGAQSMIES